MIWDFTPEGAGRRDESEYIIAYVVICSLAFGELEVTKYWSISL